MTDDLSVAVIRARRPEDLPACVEILAEVHRRDAYPVVWPQDPAGWLDQPTAIGSWVAADRTGRVLGHASLSPDASDPARIWAAHTGDDASRAATVSRLFTSPSARGLHLGERLLTETVTAALERGLHPVLGVLDQHAGALGFYQRAGWLRLETVDFRLSDGSIVPMHCFTHPPRQT
ncbi:GNAT superfamily N-acetyltransferase [Allocatelliglobosispora scoriae]|uniref:GNAT superfamily N-acetyltransferase n=1 Tax=Allocatelliglobosispora scoriae TaxID=643052 RepID=A0A841BUZ3_9ACTN|nr:GNAT family N-acetyltransferase [Allocatelliglobosispora scoriae]MBB5872927.1 GNAT superfamily N-acetyltransferase [Allocatelliglobosispora scoriae]